MSTEIYEIERELEALAKLRRRGSADDLAAMLEARLEQVEGYGHTEQADDERPTHKLGELLVERAVLARDPTFPGDRQDLAVAYRRAARVGAIALAFMRRIRTEQERQTAAE